MKKFLRKLLKRLGLLTLIKKLYRSVNIKYKIKVNGNNFKTQLLYGAVCKIDEPWMIQILVIIFKVKHGGFIDVGMNIGQTLLEVKSIDPDKKYVGFEPNSSCVMYVEELVRINKIKNVKIVPVGLYTTDTLLNLDLYYDDITNSGGSIIPDYWSFGNFYTVHRKMVVPVFSFQTVSKSIEFSDFDFIKIDVEGAELEVLQTLTEQIEKRKPIIIIEILSAYSEKNLLRFSRQKSIELLIKRLNYKILRIIEDRKGILTNVQRIEGFDARSNPDMCNYILYHQNDEDRIQFVFGSLITLP